jgi:hypothetical protein
MNILVKFEDYISYYSKYNTSYLDRKNGYRIWSPSKEYVLNGFNSVNEEIFNGTKTDYELSPNGDNYLITFKTKSNTEYRLDLIRDPNGKIYHIAFTVNDRDLQNYENITGLKESIEVFSRLSWILGDIDLDIEEYCIGATGDRRKDSIYEYMMRFVKSWEKRECSDYKLGWALYFKI